MTKSRSSRTDQSNSSGSKGVDRKTVEKNRRIYMKTLCFKLLSLVPPHHFQPCKDMLSQQDQLVQTASYIEQLKKRVEQLKRRKERALVGQPSSSHGTSLMSSHDDTMLKLPMMELRDSGSSLQLVLTTGLHKNFKLYEVITVLQEEGADVISASFSTLGDKVFHTLHAQVKISRVGVETTRLYERLQALIK